MQHRLPISGLYRVTNNIAFEFHYNSNEDIFLTKNFHLTLTMFVQ